MQKYKFSLSTESLSLENLYTTHKYFISYPS